MPDKEFEKQFNRGTCDALLLQFKEPKIYDMTIPSAYNIYSLIVIAGEIMNGKKIDPKKVNCISTNHDDNFLSKEHLSKLSKKVSEGIFNVVDEFRDAYSFLYHYLNKQSLFAHEWFFGHGDWYRFRDKEREKAEQRITNHFNKKELSEFNEIGKIIQPYIEL
ncbi:unnamed protein product, partial [marine sediment metagenome]